MESCPHLRRCSPRVQILGGGGVPASSQFLTIQKGGTSGNAPGRQHAHRQGRRQAADCQSDEAPAAGWLVTRRAAGRHQIGPRAPQPAQRTGRGARGEPATSYVGDTTTSRDPKTARPCPHQPTGPSTPLQQSSTPSKVHTHHHDPRRALTGHTGPNTGQYDLRSISAVSETRWVRGFWLMTNIPPSPIGNVPPARPGSGMRAGRPRSAAGPGQRSRRRAALMRLQGGGTR